MKSSDARLLSNAEALLSARLVKVEEALLEKGSEPKIMRKKEEKEEEVKKVRQVPILMEDGRRVVQMRKPIKNGDPAIPNLSSADFQKDIDDFVQKRDGRSIINGNGFTKRIFFQSTEEIEEVTSRSRRGPSRGWNEDKEDEEGSEKQSRRSLPPEAGVRSILSFLDCFMHHLDIDIC